MTNRLANPLIGQPKINYSTVMNEVSKQREENERNRFKVTRKSLHTSAPTYSDGVI